MLKVGGIWVSPFEVEATLMQHPSVLEAAVIGAPDADGLIKTKAFVVLKEGASGDEAELQRFVKDRLAPYKYPARIAFIAELPKTATGRSRGSACVSRNGARGDRELGDALCRPIFLDRSAMN